jgi:hypothetical protein
MESLTLPAMNKRVRTFYGGVIMVKNKRWSLRLLPNLLTSLIFLILLNPLTSMAVITFERTYGSPNEDDSYSVCQTEDGGYIIAGITDTYGYFSFDVYLIRTDAFGDTLWTKVYGGHAWDYALSVQETSDGGFVVTGYTHSFGHGDADVFLIKTDAQGEFLWIKTYGEQSGDEVGNCVQKTLDGGFIIAGSTNSNDAINTDVYLIKTDASGIVLWTQTYGGPLYDSASFIQQTLDGGYILTGPTHSFGAGQNDIYLLKTDAFGNSLWARTYGTTALEGGHTVRQTPDGGYVVLAGTTLYDAAGDIVLLKTDASGEMTWWKLYGGTHLQSGNSLDLTSDGGYIIAGSNFSYATWTGDLCLYRTDSLGDTLWTRQIGGSGTDYAFSVEQTSDGGFIMAGGTDSYGAGLYDVYLVKVDKEGRLNPE